MSLPLVYHPDVRDEIDTTYDWYEQQSPGLGEDFLSTLRELLDRIQLGPELYGVIQRRIRGAPLTRFPYVVYWSLFHNQVLTYLCQRFSSGNS